MSESYQKLIAILKEMFQLDQSDLDFGIYRIMNYKRDEIKKFLNEDLLPQVKTELEKYISVEQKGVEKELKDLTVKLEEAGVAFESSSKYVALNSRLDKGLNVTSTENEVYSHLANFFKRYYSNGDFISLRRYKKDIYALPYEGQEVKLHWANGDQYYIKTAEHFRDYTFTTPDGNKVHFKLIDAETEKDNNKSQKGKERRFVISENTPLVVENGELFIGFEYVVKDIKQKDLTNQALEIISERLTTEPDFKSFQSLLALVPTEKNPKRLLVEKYLNDYTSRNTFDYFIHKDLGGFLKREIDFYIKNEVMFLDDVEVEDTIKVEQYLTKIRVIKKVGNKIISFLDQIEGFQKKMWLKKKFVTETNYCITLDKIPEEFYPVIIENNRQIEEWKELFKINEIDGDLMKAGFSEPITETFLKQNPSLLLDTIFFDHEFKEALISHFDDLDKEINGVLIHSENFQALNLIKDKYRNKFNFIYIDPPYNREGDGFVYKDNYKHSSWLSMINDRIRISKTILNSDFGIFTSSIDKHEMFNYKLLLDSILGADSFVNAIVNVNNPKGRSDQKHLPTAHDNILFYANDEAKSYGWLPEEKVLKRYSKEENGNKYREIDLRKTGDNDLREDRPKMFYYFYFNEETNEFYPSYEELEMEGFVKIIPLRADGREGRWRWGMDTSLGNLNKLVPKFMPNRKVWSVFEKDFLTDEERVMPTSVWYEKSFNSERGTEDFIDLGFDKEDFPRPKPVGLLVSLIEHTMTKDDYILDFFAGSGTTGHAVVELNRLDDGNRKYILVEMGEYFNSVTKPRLQKVIYSNDWENGKPVSREGSSHIFKYIRLESYEDTLNNLVINLTQEQLSLLEKNPELREQYMLSYMLNNETENSMSLLNIDMFKNPFEYKLKIANGLKTQLTTIDLVETFNYLLGIEVIRNEGKKRYSAEKDNDNEVPGAVKLSYAKDGEYVFKEIEGRTLDGEKVLVIWRTLSGDIVKANAALDAYFLKKKYSTQDFEFNRIYVNGDNNLQNLKLDDERWKIVLIEVEFKKLMFDVQDV
ncbi:site-specific DNA-methyltransferase [Psychrobacillus sp. FJAT-51614]|uniref:Site-specific DNA-methyltransferase n=1 Tax=Psychrobacillus mangrovi TaxID=3117745 RepID=A0ABU8F8B9_9BACI